MQQETIDYSVMKILEAINNGFSSVGAYDITRLNIPDAYISGRVMSFPPVVQLSTSINKEREHALSLTRMINGFNI